MPGTLAVLILLCTCCPTTELSGKPHGSDTDYCTHAESPGPIRVDKHGRGPPLAAPVTRIFYLSAEGTMREHEVFPPPNPRLLTQVDTADALVYGMGSLYTSICPSLVLKVGACCRLLKIAFILLPARPCLVFTSCYEEWTFGLQTITMAHGIPEPNLHKKLSVEMGEVKSWLEESLHMQGVGEKIAERDIPKIFLLNGSHDRETSASKSNAGPMTACDVVLAVCDALNRRHAKVRQ